MWDIRGWKRLTVHDEAPLVAARQEFLSWLAKVPEPHQTSWTQRLKSNLDHPHLSVRVELYLHHYFIRNGWDIKIEPEMSGNTNKPDFTVKFGKVSILVEAKTVLDEQSTTQQTQRLRQLADNLTSKLSREVIIEPLSDLPPSLPSRRINAQIEQRAKKRVDEILEFDLSHVHQGTPYSLKIIILPRVSDSREPVGVGGTISGVHMLATGKRVRDALEQKAGKYGVINVPFLIAIYGTGEFPVRTSDELDALFGDKIWNLTASSHVTERREPNGFFTSVQEVKRRHEEVSAVLFYRFKWINDTHDHSAHIYHNPFALRPISPDLFPRIPQMVSTLKWINGEPD